jgi:SNF2 family DNA or RNA helicase
MDYTIFLTGTPIMSRPDDIFGVVQLADPKFFGSWKKFESEHIFKEFNGSYSRLIGYKGLNDLRDKVQSILTRRTEYEVTLELPETIYHRVNCEQDPIQKEVIKAIKDKKTQLLATIESVRGIKEPLPSDVEKKEKAEALVKGLAMAEQANANDPRLFLSSRSRFMKQEFGTLVPKDYQNSNKIQTLLELVDEIIDAASVVNAV